MLGDDTACALIGANVGGKPPPLSATDPGELARRAVVTFRDLPEQFVDHDLIALRSRLKETLQSLGVTVVPWCDAVVEVERGALQRHLQVVSARIHAVVDVTRAASEAILLDLENPMQTQVIAIARVDELLRDPDVPYLNKIRKAARALLDNKAVVVIGLFEDARSGVVINITLDHTVVDFSNAGAWRSWIQSVLIPKAVTPITPIVLSRFNLASSSQHSADDQVERVVQVSQALAKASIFPPGERFTELARDSVERALVAQLTDGRSGYSLGFIASGAVQYRGRRTIDASCWDGLCAVEGLPPDELRSDGGIWYVRIGERFLEVPVVHIASSASGANKTDLTVDDVVLLTADNGRLGLCSAGQPRLDPTHRPSFDTYVMIGAIYGAAFGSDHLHEPTTNSPAPPNRVIIHFHGYPDPSWLAQEGFGLAGVDNICVSCGTPQAGILNLRHSFELFSQPEITVGSLIEPGHGTNLIADVRAVDHMLGALQDGRPVELGGRFLDELKKRARA